MKYHSLLTIISFLAFLTSCVPVSTSSYTSNKKLIYDDINYESKVGMVQVFPFSQNLQSDLENPIIETGNTNGFYLQFDLFEENYSNLNVRYIHCNRDWTPSQLSDIRFLDIYNSFNVNNYEYSANTLQQYVQYSITLPTPKISGNYLIVVSSSQSDDDIILSRRALVYNQAATAEGKVAISSSVASRRTNQQVEFSVSYRGLENVNPIRDIHVILLQNHNWKVALKDLKPTLMRHDQSYLEYNHFNSENNFPGYNEFRYFDLRSVEFRGMNVINIQKNDDNIKAFLGVDKPRTGLSYSQLNQDINGSYYLVNSDPGDSQMQSEYSDVFFELKTDEINSNVYVIGRFNNWQLNSLNKMIYDTERSSYRSKLNLKQGYYDYAYWVDSPTLQSNHFEGNHFETRNDYEILIYYRDPIKNFDELVGYKKIESNFQ